MNAGDLPLFITTPSGPGCSAYPPYAGLCNYDQTILPLSSANCLNQGVIKLQFHEEVQTNTPGTGPNDQTHLIFFKASDYVLRNGDTRRWKGRDLWIRIAETTTKFSMQRCPIGQEA